MLCYAGGSTGGSGNQGSGGESGGSGRSVPGQNTILVSPQDRDAIERVSYKSILNIMKRNCVCAIVIIFMVYLTPTRVSYIDICPMNFSGEDSVYGITIVH